MAEEKIALKTGMGGSRGGRGRTAKTDVYKSASKKRRRREGKKIIRDAQ